MKISIKALIELLSKNNRICLIEPISSLSQETIYRFVQLSSSKNDKDLYEGTNGSDYSFILYRDRAGHLGNVILHYDFVTDSVVGCIKPIFELFKQLNKPEEVQEPTNEQTTKTDTCCVV